MAPAFAGAPRPPSRHDADRGPGRRHGGHLGALGVGRPDARAARGQGRRHDDRGPDGRPRGRRILATLHAGTAERADFRPRPAAFLHDAAAAFAPGGGWLEVEARLDGQAIAAMGFLRVGDRAAYLWGGSSRDAAVERTRAQYAVLAAAMEALAADGCGHSTCGASSRRTTRSPTPMLPATALSSASSAAGRCATRAPSTWSSTRSGTACGTLGSGSRRLSPTSSPTAPGDLGPGGRAGSEARATLAPPMTTEPAAPTTRTRAKRAPTAAVSVTPRVVDAQARKLVETVHERYPLADLTVDRAYRFAEQAHAGQARACGEPYVTHPLAAAKILADIGLDPVAVTAAIVHDIPEDTDFSLADIEERFGPEVAHLVDGVTKLSKFSSHTHEEQQAENLRKMFLAMAEDVRVVLIKLADRLHNMRTLGALPIEKQQRIARQTLEIYAPLAERLGIWQIKWELEDLAFKVARPRAPTGRLASAARDPRAEARETYIARARAGPRRRAARRRYRGRPRPGARSTSTASAGRCSARAPTSTRSTTSTPSACWSTSVKDCYAALGVVHSLWRPIPGQFDDYIAMPKDNGYQSLHTAVVGARRQAARGADPHPRDAPRRRVRRSPPTGATRKARARRPRLRREARLAAPAHGLAARGLRRDGVRRGPQARRLPGPGLRLHAQGRRQGPARRRRPRSTSPTGSTPTSATAASAPRSTTAWCRSTTA